MLNVYSAMYMLIPSTIKVMPITIAANNGVVNDNAPRMNGTIPNIIINIERIFDDPLVNRPEIPNNTIIIPMI